MDCRRMRITDKSTYHLNTKIKSKFIKELIFRTSHNLLFYKNTVKQKSTNLCKQNIHGYKKDMEMKTKERNCIFWNREQKEKTISKSVCLCVFVFRWNSQPTVPHRREDESNRLINLDHSKHIPSPAVHVSPVGHYNAGEIRYHHHVLCLYVQSLVVLVLFSDSDPWPVSQLQVPGGRRRVLNKVVLKDLHRKK